MTSNGSIDIDETLHQIATETGIEKEVILEKMKEKISKFGGLLTEQGALVLLSKDLNVHLPTLEKKGMKISLGELKAGMNNVDISATVKIADRIKTFTKNGKEGKYLTTRLTDETGEALYTFWNKDAEEAEAKKIRKGSKITITNARIGIFNGQVQVSLGYNGTCIVEGQEGEEIEKKEEKQTPLSNVRENESFEGNVHVVDVLPGKGYYVRCTACQAKLMERSTSCPQCGKEGKVETKLLVSLLVDDGTATMRGVAFGETAAKIYGKEKEDVLSLLENEKERIILCNDVRGKYMHILGRGKIGMDRTSTEIVIQEAEKIPFPPE
ncbi:MAG: hypothetical protein V1776_00480 [Candidatus Diapherotrites archaeon]